MVDLRLPFTTSAPVRSQKCRGLAALGLVLTLAACGEAEPRGCEATRDGVAVVQLGTAADDVGRSVAIGRRCEAVVLGMTNGTLVDGEDADGELADLFVMRWGPEGTSTLRRQFGTEFADRAESVAVDVQGSIIAVGGAMPSADPALGTDVLAVKLAEDGAETWRVVRGEPDLTDLARSVAVDAFGQIFIAGMTNERVDRGTEMFLLERDPEGGSERMTYVGSAEAPVELGEAVALDDGEVVLVGSSRATFGGAPAGGFDMVATRLRQNRSEAWALRRGTGDIDAALDVVIDGEGNTWVAAVSYADLVELQLENDGFPSGFLFKYDRDGALRLARRLGGVGEFVRINALALAEDGGVFAAGVTEVQLGEASFGGRDAFVARYDANGERRWTHQLGSEGADEAHAVALDPRGTVVVTGQTSGDVAGTGNHGGLDAFVAWFEVR